MKVIFGMMGFAFSRTGSEDLLLHVERCADGANLVGAQPFADLAYLEVDDLGLVSSIINASWQFPKLAGRAIPSPTSRRCPSANWSVISTDSGTGIQPICTDAMMMPDECQCPRLD
jgi:hypothetical protein